MTLRVSNNRMNERILAGNVRFPDELPMHYSGYSSERSHFPSRQNAAPSRDIATGWWSQFLFAEVPPHSLAAFRILFGTYLLGYFLSYASCVNLVFSSAGVTNPYLIPDWSLPPVLCTALYCVNVIVIVSFIVGWRTNIISPLLLTLYGYFYFLNIAVRNTAHERLNLILLVLLCFARLDAAWSLSVRKRDRTSKTPTVSVWPIRMITMQIFFIYFGAGLWKLCNLKWHTGDLLYHNFFGIWATPMAFWVARLGLPMALWTAMSWSIITWELLMGFALFSRRFRSIAVITGTTFHLLVIVFLYVPEFLNCVAAYVLFFPPEVIRKVGSQFFNQLSGLFGNLAGQ